MMKRSLNLLLLLVTLSTGAFAGNPDRIGESGANNLLMNGWARSTGMWDMYVARVMGIDATRLNPAGLAFSRNMEAAFAQTLWFQGSGVQLTQGGIAGRIGEDNIIGLSIFNMNMGDFYRTTVAQPDPNNGLGTFSPNFLNLGISYARVFSENIYGGVTVRMINQSIEDARSSGVAVDLGIQYVTGKKDNLRFGVSLRNVGTPMTFSGDGFSFLGTAPSGDFDMTLAQNSQKFELPIQFNMGASYDIWLGPEYVCNRAYNLHRLTVSGQYTSNSYGKDNYGVGVEYALKEMFMLRAGYRFENGMYSDINSTNAHTGIAAGTSFEYPFKDNGPTLGIDYSYRHSNPWNGTHSIGLRFSLGDGGEECEDVGEDAGSSRRRKKVKLSKDEKQTLASVAESIAFETGSDELTPDAEQQLDQLISILDANADANLRVSAHTDNVGSEDENYELSRQRAEAVKDYLVESGVAKERIETLWYGEREPIADNATEEGRAQNRRVELELF